MDLQTSRGRKQNEKTAQLLRGAIYDGKERMTQMAELGAQMGEPRAMEDNS